MKIALDYDGTYTLDPNFWYSFILVCKDFGHDIRIVTLRKPEMNNDMLDALGTDFIPVLYTSNVPKRIYCDSIDWQPQIWIDDTPEFIVRPDFHKFVETFGENKENAHEPNT